MMKKNTLPYLILLGIFVFAMTALLIHLAGAGLRFSAAAGGHTAPFTYTGATVSKVEPAAEAAGLRQGDRIIEVNGTENSDFRVFREAYFKTAQGEPMRLEVERQTESGTVERADLVIPALRLEKNFSFYARFAAGIVFSYVLPAFCMLLGFWVVFMRPRDYLAWILLFLLLGLSAIGIEGYSANTIVGTYQRFFIGCWGLAMLLFGIYFPERIGFDRKHPWLKFVLIVPLCFQVVVFLANQIQLLGGIDLLSPIAPITNIFGKIAMPLNVLSVGLFFALLGWKSGTLKSPDARRRVRLMVVGTTTALTPAFIIVLYSLFSGARGSFFDIAPWWLALLALFAVPLFPLTMAYVIVVQRAMDVSVVVRQGLQYALAQNGVKVLQFFLLIGVIFGILSIFRNYEGDIAAQVGFVAGGFALIPLISYGARSARVWIDRKFFRDAYDAEQILIGLSEDVRTIVEIKPLLETLTSKISESLHVPHVALLLKSGETFRPAHALGYQKIPAVSFSTDAGSFERLRKNEAVVIYNDDSSDPLLPDDADERKNLRELNSQLLLPVGAKDELSGVLSLGPKLSEEPYSANDIRLLKTVAAQAGLALENSRLTEVIAHEAAQKERLNRELEIAREVQERLFPQSLPKIDGLQYYGACRPALGVGGDYYDFFELPDGRFGIAIGDVSGKGIGASLMMASLQASLRGQAIHSSDDLAALMCHVNRLVYEASTTNRYATFFYAQFDPSSRRLIYVNAGHNPPYLLRPHQGEFEIIPLEAGGAVVGMLPPMLVNYEQGEIDLRPGDLIAGFTDGISEAMNNNEEEWGEEAMLAAIKKQIGRSPREIIESVVAEADKFADGAKQHDDMTMIILAVD